MSQTKNTLQNNGSNGYYYLFFLLKLVWSKSIVCNCLTLRRVNGFVSLVRKLEFVFNVV